MAQTAGREVDREEDPMGPHEEVRREASLLEEGSHAWSSKDPIELAGL